MVNQANPKPACSLLISDLHLSANRPDLCQAFANYCRDIASTAQSLFILGDLSDAWLGDDEKSATAELIRTSLKALTAGGTVVKILPGNRDFLMGSGLANECNLSILADPTLEVIHDHRILLLHGDSLCVDDVDYMKFRRRIQSPLVKKLLLALPLGLRSSIASGLRAQSKSANARKAEEIMDVNQIAVNEAFRDNAASIMIHGHTHRPRAHEYSIDGATARRYVLGDWDTLGWQIRVTREKIELQSFDLQRLITETGNHDRS